MLIEKLKLWFFTFKKPILIVFSLIIFYALLGFVALPMLLTAKLPEIVAENTGKKAQVQDVKFDPFSFQLSIRGFDLTETDGEKIVSFKELYINLDIFSSIQYWALGINKIYLDQPLINVIRRKDNSINLTTLSANKEEEKVEEKTEDTEPFPIWLGQIKIHEGEVDITDQTLETSFFQQITGLNLDIEQLATIQLDDKVADSLSLNFVDGGKITWKGDIELEPDLLLGGHLEVADFNSDMLKEYIQQSSGYDLQLGKWSLQTDYTFKSSENSTEFHLDNSKLSFFDILNKGASLQWQGQVAVLPVMQSTGQLNLSAISLKTIWQYLPESVEFKVSQGHLDLSSDYEFAIPPGKDSEMQLTLPNTEITLKDVLEDGDQVHWQASSKVLPDIHSTGEINISNVDLHKIWLQTQKDFDLKIQQGKFNLLSQYRFDKAKDEEEPQLLLSGAQLSGQHVAFSGKDSDKSLVTLSDVQINGLDLDLKKRTLNVASVQADQGKIIAIIEQSGELNLSTAFTGRATETVLNQAEQAVPEATSNPWEVFVKQVNVSNYRVDAKQYTKTKPIHFDITPINIRIDNFSTAAKQPFQVATDITVNKKGKIKTKGKITLQPLSVATNLKISDLSLMPLQPLLQQNTRLELIRGNLEVNSNIAVSQKKSQAPDIKISGDVAINRLKTIETDTKKPFLKLQKLAVRKFNVALDPVNVKVAHVDINGLDTKVIINKDRTTNISYIFSPPGQKETPPAAQKKQKTPTKKGKEPVIAIKSVNVSNTSAFYADNSLVLPFAANIKKLNGTVKNVSNHPNTRSKVHLQGTANNTAPVLIKGEMEPFRVTNYLDILMQFDNMNLTGMTPYMAEFAGYKIEKGKLSVELEYNIQNQHLEAGNRVEINQLTLGDEVESPNKVSVPVKLAIGLLKDRNGNIDLSVPVSGDLNDPEFSLAGTVGKVLLNLLTKVVTSPFTAISGLLNTDADLSKIAFKPGSAMLDEEQKQNLDTLAIGLNERPQLQLEIRGKAFKMEDSQGIAEYDIMHQIKSEVWHDLDKDERPENISDTSVPDEDFQDLLTDLFEDQFDSDADDDLVDAAEDAEDPEKKRELYQKMLTQLAASKSISKEALIQLATKRARVVNEYLIHDTPEFRDRIYLLGHEIADAADEGGIAVALEIAVRN